MKSILHIDNSSFFKKILNDIFKEKGYISLSADSIESAFEILTNNQIDLIITAMEFKGGGGITFLQKLNNSQYKNTPTIVITSNDSIEERKNMFSLGVIDYIPKNSSFGEKLLNFVGKLTEENTIKDELKNLEIAVVDDSKIGLNVVKNILKLNGIIKADFYQQPELFIMSDKKYHIYLIDLVMPGISGEQIILDIRKKYSDSIIIAISSIDNYKVISNILLSGANDYILKPFNASIFMARLISNARTLSLLRELEKNNKKLKDISMVDPLTNFYNRYVIMEKFENEISEAQKNQKRLSAILFGVDHFVSFNEQYGHKIGDKILKNIARIAKENLNFSNIPGRYSGVEFIIIMPGAGLNEALDAAEKIKNSISRLSLKNRKITISGGVAEYMSGTGAELAIKLETLLYKARKNGKNRIEIS